MFLDDAPPAAQRAAFQQYMQNGGAWMGFHVSAFNTDPSSWSWYYNTFLGTGAFRTNTWGPTARDHAHREPRRTRPPLRLPATFTSSVSEWYSWSNDLRQNPNIDILASIDPSSFPVGTDPNQSWYSGYYPIMWTNRNYKMLYANFGHNAMNYTTNTRLSSTFASELQNRLLIDGLLWLGGRTAPRRRAADASRRPTGPISPTAWYSVVNRAAASASTPAPPPRPTAPRSSSTPATAPPPSSTSSADQRRVHPGQQPLNSAQALDVTDVSAADNAPIQLWSYSGGNNQQWQPVAEGGGYYPWSTGTAASASTCRPRRPPTASSSSSTPATAPPRSRSA